MTQRRYSGGRRIRAYLALLAIPLVSCGSPATVASFPVPAPQPVQPAIPVTSLPTAPAVVQAPKRAAVDSVRAHVRVVIPRSTGYVIAVDQRFVQDLVANQPYMVNAICDANAPFPQDRTYIMKGDSLYLDMMSCAKVVREVVLEWFYAWGKLASANPLWTPKQIQDAISAGAY